MKEFPKNLPECDLIDNFVLKRLRKGLHNHVLVTGLQGRGKSDFAIRMGERLSSRIKNGIEFKHTDIVDSLLKLIKRIKQITKRGEIIVIEEVSVLFPSRRAMQKANVSIGKILDTIRKKQAILISNAPLYTSIDLHMRALAEVLVECKRVIKKEKLVEAKAWILQTAPHSGKTYRHRFRRGSMITPYFYSKQSNKDIRQAYELDKDKFIDKLLQTLESAEEKENGKIEEQKKGSWIQEEIYRLMHENRLNIKETAKKLNISIQKLYRHLSILTEMGRNPTIYLEKAENNDLTATSKDTQINLPIIK